VASIVSDGIDGFLVDHNNPDDLEETLTQLIGNSDLGKSMGMRGREKLERRYCIEHIGDIVVGTYARVLRQSHMR
jgi:glycosyltransferase involved in cell wall biosynthesis